MSELEVKLVSNPNKLKIEVLNAKIHTVMNFKGTDITQNKCTICRIHLMAPTIEDSDKGDLKCQISKGKCGHFFHTDCINKHIKSGNISCPIDFSAWNLDKILDTGNKSWNRVDTSLSNNKLKDNENNKDNANGSKYKKVKENKFTPKNKKVDLFDIDSDKSNITEKDKGMIYEKLVSAMFSMQNKKN